ncbi:MAG: hypothetical protein IPP94_16780 [Ignavibacteria bacterium]|nr:hypothetical protein [Ignavibacteria bacterium]
MAPEISITASAAEVPPPMTQAGCPMYEDASLRRYAMPSVLPGMSKRRGTPRPMASTTCRARNVRSALSP